MIEVGLAANNRAFAALAQMGDMPQLIKRAGEQAAQATAERFLEGLKDNWEGQKAILWPLTQAYQEQKAKKGLDSRILIATGELLSSLQIIEKNGSFTVGTPRGETHSSTGIELEKLLKIIEFGSPSRNLPSRAILRQTAKSMQNELIDLFRKELKKAIREEMSF